MVKCYLITLDSGLNESYAKLLEEGKNLTINYNTFTSRSNQHSNKFNQIIDPIKIRICSLLKGYASGNGGRENMVAAIPWNDFFSPMSPDVEDDTLYYNQDGEFEAQVAIGGKLFPEYPIRGHREAY